MHGMLLRKCSAHSAATTVVPEVVHVQAWMQLMCVTLCLPQDFVAQHSSPNIAYGAFHFWPVCPHFPHLVGCLA